MLKAKKSPQISLRRSRSSLLPQPTEEFNDRFVTWYAELQIRSRPLFPEGFDSSGRLVSFAPMSDESLSNLLRHFPRLMQHDQVLERIMQWWDYARNAPDRRTRERARKHLRFLDPVLPRSRGQKSLLPTCLREDYAILKARLAVLRKDALSLRKHGARFLNDEELLKALKKQHGDSDQLQGWTSDLILHLRRTRPSMLAIFVLSQLYGHSEDAVRAAIKRHKKMDK